MNTEECSICGLDINEKYCYKLYCNHTFHYECLLKTFLSSKKITYKHNNHCPYCREKCEYLPVVNGLKKLEVGIHVKNKEDLSDENGLPKNKNEPCKAILQRGKNKGNQCNKKCLLGYEYCGLHKKYIQ